MHHHLPGNFGCWGPRTSPAGAQDEGAALHPWVQQGPLELGSPLPFLLAVACRSYTQAEARMRSWLPAPKAQRNTPAEFWLAKLDFSLSLGAKMSALVICKGICASQMQDPCPASAAVVLPVCSLHLEQMPWCWGQ